MHRAVGRVALHVEPHGSEHGEAAEGVDEGGEVLEETGWENCWVKGYSC